MISQVVKSSAPTVLLVGFLGAGKTTFLRNILPLLAERGLRPYVLINDYQNARVDAGSLRELADEVEAINGNCVCCDSIHELINRLLSIPEVPGRVVLIEANGTTDPFALIDHLMVHEELRQRFAPLIQLGVIDVSRWQKRTWHNDLERMQAESASHLVYSRADSVPHERCARVRSDLEWLNPRSVETAPEQLAEELSSLVADIAPEPSGGNLFAIRREKGRTDHSLAHGFVALQIDLPSCVDGTLFVRWLQDLPPNVLRAKGLVQIAQFPDLNFVFHRTDDPHRKPTMFPLPMEPTVAPCAVLIGVRLSEEEIRREAISRFGVAERLAA